MHGTPFAQSEGALVCSLIVCRADTLRNTRATKARLRASYASWRIVVCLTQPQTPLKADVQRAWEEARLQSPQADMDVSYIEARMTPMTDSLSYPLSLLNKFCTDIEGGKTVLSLIIGGGSAARFLVTAAAALNLPALWLPFMHRDFLRQGNLGRFETRIGSSSKEVGAAAAALMHRANWHAFTLLIDTTLLPVNHLLQTNQPILTPRSIIHLPTNDKTLRLRLRRVAEEGGTGGVVVMGCDLNNARRILAAASKFEMLSGRFLWLWLDLKAELRPNEPNIINSHILHSSRSSIATNENSSPLENIERNANLILESELTLNSLPSLTNDIHRLQEYRWKNEKIIMKREEKGFNFDDEEEFRMMDKELNSKSFMPVGMLALRPSGIKIMGGDTILSRMLRETSQALDETLTDVKPRINRLRESQLKDHFIPECFPDRNSKFLVSEVRENVSKTLTNKLRKFMGQISKDKAEFQLLNLQAVRYPGNKTQLRWTKVGTVKGGREVRLDTIVWPGGGIVPAYLEQGGEKIGMPVYRIVTALASPFTMAANLQEGLCLRGLPCRLENTVMCCYGLSMDLLSLVAREMGFRFDLYLVRDGLFGKRNSTNGTWNGIMGELVSGRAQLAFAPMSVSAHRAEVVDFTTPYFFSGVSFLTAPKLRSEIPLFAFLSPFSMELWIAVFTSLNFTAIAVALYEWFSPFGLNPWGRQRSKNFSIASALWVMWGLLCGHLVAFKAPKSWPNKFLINIWGGFSVIFVASYTANIAALIAGLSLQSAVSNYRDKSLLSQKVGAPRASAAEYYVQKAYPQLWSHMAQYSLSNVAEGVESLRNGSLDILIADTPILDYYRAIDDGCRLQKIGDTINEDTYAIALTKGHPLKESISKVIANYTSNGLLDILQEKWYGGLPCIRGREGMEAGLEPEPGGQPRPLGVAYVAGVFCLLGMGVVLGAIILAGEHLFYKYTLPRLRHRPEDSIWRSRNVMFFSQKLYRFINCVELVSPHHAAKELVHTVRQGQIASLFQKSVKRKEHEQRRRRKSKAQFFEMIQEIRRVQQEEKIEAVVEEPETVSPVKEEKVIRGRERSRSKSPLMPCSPKRSEKSRSSTNLSSSRLGLSPINLETPIKPREFTLSSTNLRARSPLETVGRRLSHGDGGSPPPRLGSHFGGSATLRPLAPTKSDFTGGGTPTIKSDTAGGGAPTPRYSRSPAKRGQSFPVFATLRPPHSSGHQMSKSPLLSPNSELTSAIGRKLSRDWGSGTIDLTRSSEAVASGSTYTLNQETTLSLERAEREKRQEDIIPIKKPIRRARSHENRDSDFSLAGGIAVTLFTLMDGEEDYQQRKGAHSSFQSHNHGSGSTLIPGEEKDWEGTLSTEKNGDLGDMTFCMANYVKEAMKMMFMMRSHHMLTDVILEVGSELFHAHKVILAAASPYFKAMFTGGLKECEMTRVKLQGVCPTTMARLMYFMYTGQIRVTEITVCSLLSAATMFQVSNVIDACSVFLERQLDPTNAIGIANFAEQHGCQDLYHKANQFIVRHFNQICQEEEFLQLSAIQLVALVRKDELNVQEEREVYNAVLKWVKYNEEARGPKMEHILHAVRCQYLTPNFLREQMKNCDVLKKVPACREYLAQIFKDLTLHKKPVVKERTPNTPRVIYVAGGFLKHSLDVLEGYNVDDKTWTEHAKLIVPRSGLGGAFLKGMFYAVGGRNNTPGSRYDSDWVDRYNPVRDQWRPCSPMSVPRNRVGVAVMDGLLYAVGGSAGAEYHNSVECYDPDQDSWTNIEPMHIRRLGVGVAVVNRLLYAIGGFDGKNRLNSVECYHPENDEWTMVSSMKCSRSGAGVASLGQYIYVIGGYDGTRQLNSVERYDTEHDVWEYVSNVTIARSALSVTVLDDKLYAMGGYDGSTFLSIVEIYDPAKDQWEQGVSMTSGRSGHASAVSYHQCPIHCDHLDHHISLGRPPS
ncbi:hypothetical protein KM043_012819 [Ampulex compressa]|nr:hypothetical protein KM043_012819 [Ampulex compressa]